MTRSMIHRGPDDGGIEVLAAAGGLLGLGARRLAIQDPSPAGHQPMWDPATGNWLVFNGEIYNFRQLRSELQNRDVGFRSATDTEVLLRAYATWGLDSIARLRGMFAFGLWDAKASQLVIGRDPLGVKPLYYAETGAALLFASEMRALLSCGLVQRNVSAPGLVSYLALGAVQEPATIIENIQMMPAGHYAVCKGGQVRFRQFWSLEQQYAGGAAPSLERNELIQRVRSSVANSVRRRLISDVPVGIFLSGGLDSSTVTALAAQQSAQPIKTLSVVFQERKFSERSYIDQVRRRYATDHTECCLTAEELVGLLPEVLGAMDQPTFDGANTYVVSRQARMAGLTVVLSGIGGDELFGGYASFKRVPRLHLLRQLVPPRLKVPVAEAVRIVGRDKDQARKLSRWIAVAPDLNGSAEALLRELFAPSDRQSLLSARVEPRGDVGPVSSLRARDTFNSVSLFEASHYLRNVLLRDTDVMSMANSIEVREPLLDQDLVELVAALPGGLKRRHREQKPLLAEALRADLPQQVLNRRKMGFAFPFDEWLRGPLKGPVEEALLDSRFGGQVAELLDPVAVNGVLNRFRAGSGTWVRAWSLYVLKQWGERYLRAPVGGIG